jgi:hypothetical protein
MENIPPAAILFQRLLIINSFTLSSPGTSISITTRALRWQGRETGGFMRPQSFRVCRECSIVFWRIFLPKSRHFTVVFKGKSPAE